ncbi:MAG TPA: (d)CMP kinase [Methylomirabilota bacterium]|nr:(d)CMP kinase [Methylomirabilota bacterium]
MDKKTFAIAIDGPVAAGKGTIALQLAKDLNGLYLYTGAMYRAVALYCLEKGIDLQDERGVVATLPEITIQFVGETVLLNGQDVTEKLKALGPAAGSSVVGVYPKVREDLVHKQQQIGKEAMLQGKIVISEGRDTGTKVFPDSPLKIYLTAADSTRAQRRLKQYQAQERTVSFDEVLAEIRERDTRDKGRETDPLPSNPEALGYFIIDDSTMTEEATLQTIHKELKRRELL